MTTSGTASFSPDFLELIEEAYERAGIEMRGGYDLRTARRSLNIMSMEWANRGLNLWTVEQGTIPLVAGTATYALPADTVDLLEHVVRLDAGNVSSQTDYNLDRVSVSTYANTPNKLTRGRPTQVYVQRTDPPQITLWPVPDQSYTLIYWRMRRIQDVGAYANTYDAPFRFIPALAAGLAYHLAMKRPEATGRIEMLKAYYEEQFILAAQEDRDRASVQLVPYYSPFGP